MGISLDTARKLKTAGIAPLYGHLQEEWQYKCEYHGELKYEDDTKRVHIGRHEIREYYPLEYILAEIEKRGYGFSLAKEYAYVTARLESINYSLMLWKAHCRIEIFYAATPEDAATNALLWILEREQND